MKYIRAEHGDHFCVSVAGYPEGHPEKIKVVEGGKAALSEAELARCSTQVMMTTEIHNNSGD